MNVNHLVDAWENPVDHFLGQVKILVHSLYEYLQQGGLLCVNVSQISSKDCLSYLLDDLQNLAMVRLCDDHFVNVFLAFDVDWSESSQFRWRHSLLPSLGLIVLDAEERRRLEVTDSCRTALGKLFAGNVLAIYQPEFWSEIQ